MLDLEDEEEWQIEEVKDRVVFDWLDNDQLINR